MQDKSRAYPRNHRYMSVVIDAVNAMSWNNRAVLIACSGGVDSMVLLHALVAAGLKPEVIHINYHLRGNDSDSDEKLVVETAARFGLKIQVHHCLPEVTKSKGTNLQAAARQFRRHLFKAWISRSENHVVVLAHHLDDQLETFFLQYFRGGGLFGLGGMHPDHKGIVRPFLEVPKQELIRYAAENKIVWREDSSNAGNSYLRNVFRNKLLPDLKKEHPDLAENAAIIMVQLRELQLQTLEEIESRVEEWKTNRRMSSETWTNFTEEQKLAFIHNVNWPSWLLKRLDSLAEGRNGGRIELPDSQLEKQQGMLVETNLNTITESRSFSIEEVDSLPVKWSKDELYLDAVRTGDDLKMRVWRSGDRIKSIGLKGSQLVSDILKDAKIPLSERKQVSVLTSNEEILWIPGLKVSRLAVASADSPVIWKITLI